MAVRTLRKFTDEVVPVIELIRRLVVAVISVAGVGSAAQADAPAPDIVPRAAQVPSATTADCTARPDPPDQPARLPDSNPSANSTGGVVAAGAGWGVANAARSSPVTAATSPVRMRAPRNGRGPGDAPDIASSTPQG